MSSGNIDLWLKKAREERFAIGAFNAANIETFKAIVGAAKKMSSPVIIEASHGEVEFIGGDNLVDLVKNAREEMSLPIFTNLDHAPTVEDAMDGVDWGFDMIHYNGSKLSLKENVKNTKRVVEAVKGGGSVVEAEINPIVGESAEHMQETAEEIQKQGEYTDPQEAEEFVKETGVDILASFVGNLHGVYKTPPKIDVDRLKEIGKRVDCYLSLHGGSGIPDDQVKMAIERGVVKVNVNSEMRIIYRETLEKVLEKNDEVAIYKIMPEVINMVQGVVEKKIELLGSKGKA
jgi:fructose-bisphosphate aldolase, class II